MADDPLSRARDALQRAQSDASEASAAVAPHLLEALDQITAALYKFEAAEQNLAVQQALLDDRLLRVERNRLFTAINRIVGAGMNILRRAHISSQDRSATETEDRAAYAKWVAHEEAGLPSLEQARAASSAWPFQPTISFVGVIRSGEGATRWLHSLRQQVYPNRELCAAVERSNESQLAEGRVRSVPLDSMDDVQALNAAAKLATGQYLSFLPESGMLSSYALYYVAEALQHGPYDVIYSDEDSLDAQQVRERPIFKPDWSPDLLLSSMYLGQWVTIGREKFLQAGGFSSECGGAHLFDLLLRLAEGDLRVQHIPKVLYHGTSAASSPPQPAAMMRAITQAVARRERTESTCVPASAPGTWLVKRNRPATEFTAIICSKSPELLETCLSSLRATANRMLRQVVVVAHQESAPDPALHAVIQRAGAAAVTYRGPFHFAAMNNLAAGMAEASNLLFLNDDVRATQSGWAELLAEQIAVPEVGVAGAVLWYPTGVLQHAGIVAGIGDGVGHVGRYMRFSALWPWLLATRNVSAVTGACLAIRKELFAHLSGFDTLFPNNYNDVDLCFRVRAQGYRVVCVPVAGLIHAECQSRPGVVRFEERYRFYERWVDLLRTPDPYYSQALAPSEKIVLNLTEDGWYRSFFRRLPG